MRDNAIYYSEMPGEAAYRRFCVDARRANSKLFERLKYLDPHEMHKEFHYIAHTRSDRVVGDLAIQVAPNEEGVIWLKHISVDPDFQRKGIATSLLARCVEHIVSAGKILEISNYSESGRLFLKRKIDAHAEFHPSLIRKPWLEREENRYRAAMSSNN